jgi:DivIVA domain-containing protein
VALDRQSIARRDFPQARRGYDPASVDRHLAAIADEVEQLRRQSAPGAALAGRASEQVRSVIEAAEVSAAGIREAASAEAREHVARVAEAADGLRERIDALDQELTGMIGALRSGADRVRAELDDLAAGTSRLAAADAGEAPAGVAPSALGATVGAAAAGVATEEVGEEPALAAVDEPSGGEAATPAEPAATTESTAAAEATAAAAPAAAEAGTTGTVPAGPGAPVGRSTDVAGARIVALQWVMDGRPREETDRHLAEHFDLPDRAALLDQVYAIVPKA